jgi:sulfite reductase (ferredoxin)
MEMLADLAEEYSDEICHVTTRQDFQLHFVHIDDTPDIMRRLASVGITTREACGNSVRNVTACPLAGVCRDESFDVTPYAKAIMRFLLGHPDTQDFGRKFKIAFSGCRQHACGLVTMHDMGAIAVTRTVDGTEKRGFELYVGGGLGAVPHEAVLFDEFVSEDEILPLAQATARVFARLGEKRNRARARLKFLIKKLGLEEFKRLVHEERAQLPHDDNWSAYISELPAYGEQALKSGETLNGGARPQGFDAWQATNVYQQRQPGYCVATVTLPLGDLTSDQMRRLADVARRYVGESVRTTVEQNMVLRWVRESDLPALYEELDGLGLGQPGAGSIVDVTACPGTDTCKLGIASSRGLAAELRTRLAAKSMELDQSVRDLRIKISGCFNSCGQHHISDLGFYGVSRNIGGFTVPHFQVVLGGQWTENAASYGLPMGAVPSKNIPAVVERITEAYLRNREKSESFQQYAKRVGKKAMKEVFADLVKVPAREENASYYSDWRDPREFTIGDMGVGECAGEVVTQVEFDLAAAEELVFEAQLHLDESEFEQGAEKSFAAMLQAARGLVKVQFLDVPDSADEIVREFRSRFYDTEIFFDKYAGGKFANYLFRRHQEGPYPGGDRASTRQEIEEANLFIEAARACQARIAGQKAPITAGPATNIVTLEL